MAGLTPPPPGSYCERHGAGRGGITLLSSDQPADAAALRASEELTCRLIEAMPGGVVHVRIDGSIERANAEAQAVLGMRMDEMTGRYVADWSPETIWEDGSPCTAEDYPVTLALVTGERQGPDTIGIRRPDGQLSWAVFNAVPVRDPDSGEVSGAVVTFLDITERKRAEEAERELQSRLVIADRMASVGTLAAAVAHEINNPLTYVLTSLQLLEGELTGKAASSCQRLRDIKDGLARIRNVARDLNAFSHDDESDSVVDVHAILESSLRIAGGELKYRARVERDYSTVPPVHGNPARLGQVFLNLLVNAGHAIVAGKVHENAVTVRTRKTDDGRVEVAISDTGCGVAPEIVDSLFEPFVTTKPIGQGTGLGLFICRRIINALGGEIVVESEPGAGTTFRVLLPPSHEELSFAIGSDPAISVGAEPAPSLRVLVIDDEPGILDMFERALAHHQVTLATSGRQALHELEEREFDLVFCDLIMPDVTGMEVFETASERWPELVDRFVFITGGAFTPRARRFVEVMGSVLLHKPFGEPDVQQWVAKRAARLATPR